MMLSTSGNDINSQCRYFIQPAMLFSSQIAIAHQRHLFTLDTDDAVNNIAAAFHPSQHYMTYLQIVRFDQVNTLTAANNERQHAVTLYGKGYSQAFIHQGNGVAYDFVVANVRHLTLHDFPSSTAC